MTVSAPKFATRDIISIFVGLVFILGLIFAYKYVANRNSDDLSVKGVTFKTEIVSTKEAMSQGLSGRDKINNNAAMVFDFGETAQHCMWMKDMKFAIDILWLDESDKIIAIERSVKPESFPDKFCHNGKTVVELAAGTVDRLPLYTGDVFRY